MKRAIAVLALATACANDSRDPDSFGEAGAPFTECDGDAQSFVRQSFLSLVGRRPKSQAEVDVYVDLYTATETAGGNPRDAVARAIMTRPEYSDRWIETFMDALHVQRLDIQNESNCWDSELRTTVGADLARFVRDGSATGPAEPGGKWTMVDLARSALALDDITPLYRAQLFSMTAHPIPAANVEAKEAELARRADYGDTFDSAYLHRDIVCLGCHTSDRSVTDNDDPVLDRHWPVPGAPEAAVFGTGVLDPNDAHGMFRVVDYIDGTDLPWGWTASCGSFADVVPADPYGNGAKLAGVVGTQETVYDLEQAMMKGFASLRGHLPPIGDTNRISDPDTALAWMITLKITEDVFKRATGTSLTIANYFPRNQASSDLLYSLASRYTESGYSLKALLVAIVSSDYFNRQPAEAGCGGEVPYTYPAVFDPWVTSERIRERRSNSPADAITALDARTLVSATATALDWSAAPAASRFPDYGDTGCDTLDCDGMQGACSRRGACCKAHRAACQMNGVDPAVEVPFERAVGVFLRNSEAGFRGLDFQARLAFEERYGTCTKPKWVQSDFVDAVIAAGKADSSATVRDLVAVLKDRLIGEPDIATPAEEAALVGLFGGELSASANMVGADTLRRLCGALVGSPQFQLQGMAGRGGPRPKLTPAGVDYAAVCSDVATRVSTVACDGGKLTLRP